MLGIVGPSYGIGADIGPDAIKIVTVANDVVVKRPLPETLAEWSPAVNFDAASIVTSRNRFEPLDDVGE